ncbi:MAG: hypothetical protein WCP58_12215 [bacterium]
MIIENLTASAGRGPSLWVMAAVPRKSGKQLTSANSNLLTVH